MTDKLGKGPHGPVSEHFMRHHYGARRGEDEARYTNQLGARVGPWKIADIGNGHIYVGHESGEGGSFKVEQLLPYLEEFWREQFYPTASSYAEAARAEAVSEGGVRGVQT